MTLLTTKDAIQNRRSIRKFKSDPVPKTQLMELVAAAGLAPSGCNAQPWRFKIVEDAQTKQELAKAAFDQAFVAQAPAVIVCCADLGAYLDGAVSGIQDLGRIGAVADNHVEIIIKRANSLVTLPVDQLGPQIAFNVAIAIEHMVLRALDFGLGTCWIRLLDGPRVNQIFGWDDKLFTVALLPVGYPAEDPPPRKRKPIEDLLIP